MGFPDVWSETALVAISPKGGTDQDFIARVETIDIDEGDKPVDYINNIQGGRLRQKNPQESTTVTLELYPVSIEATDEGLSAWFHDPDADTSTGTFTQQGEQIESALARKLFRVIVLWHEVGAQTSGGSDIASATDSVGATSAALRWLGAEATLTTLDKSFTDGVLKYTATFEIPAFDKDGGSNTHEDSHDGTDDSSGDPGLAAPSSYTDSTKF